MRKHDRTHFYKYTSAEVAKLIVKNQNLKWSSPQSFNDPFDHKFNILDVNFETLKDKFARALEELVYDSSVSIDTSTEIGRMLHHMQLNSASLPRKELKAAFEEASNNFTEGCKDTFKLMETDIEDFLAKSRVLCLTEKNDNLLMWAHYGPSHTGAVLKLDIVEGEDINLLVAKKVNYDTKFPSIASEKEWIDNFLHIKRFEPGDRYYTAICTKSIDWSYEDEWRLSLFEAKNEPYGESFIPYPKSVFGALYLGAKMDELDKRELIELAEAHLPDMEVWEANIGKNQYIIEFTQIK